MYSDSAPKISQGPPKILDSGAVIACVTVGVCLVIVLLGGLFYRCCVYDLGNVSNTPLIGTRI
jgi:hypothetical protein